MNEQDIYSYVKLQESRYETEEIQVGDNWEWNMRNHIQLLFHLKNGIFFTGENDWLRSFRNIMRPILGLCKWTEDIDLKDVVFFIERENGKAVSFLLKKYHDEVYSREHDLDKMIDDIEDSDLDYGGAIVQRGADVPEVLRLKTIAFCDQTDVMGGPIGFKLNFSPDKLRGMAKYGWGKESNGATVSLDELAILACDEKEPAGNNSNKNRVTGKNIEVYIVRGSLPEDYLKDNGNTDDYYSQLHILAFYVDKNDKKQGVTLYRKKADKGDLKFFSSEPVEDRGLGYGVGESLLHPQIWTNFLTIHKTNMLEAGSKVILQSDDPNFTNQNNVSEMENLQVAKLEDGKRVDIIPTINANQIQLFSNEINSWYDQAQLLGAAFDPLMGKDAPSGQTFRGQERVVAQGKGIHDYRRGKRAKFIEEIYRDWIIPNMIKEIKKGKKFLASLTTDELRWVADQMAINATNNRLKELILEGKVVTPEEQQLYTETFKKEFLKRGDKHLIEIIGNELDGLEDDLRIGIDVAGKQKDLVNLSDKYLSIMQSFMANPQGFQQAMQQPALAKAFENILEFGGMSIGDFSSLLAAPQTPSLIPDQTQGKPSPLNFNQPTKA